MRFPGWPSWIRSYLARYKRQVALALALGAVASACAALLMFTSGYLISATALATTTLFSVMVPIACVQLFGLGRPFARYAERLASHDWVLRITSSLRLSLFEAIEARTGDPARERAAGEYLALLADDVAHLQNLYLRVVFPSAIAYLMAALASLLFGFFSAAFGAAMLLSLVAVTVPLPLFSLLATRALSHEVKQAKGEHAARLTDDVSGSVDWVLAGRGGEAAARNAQADGRARSLESAVRMRQRAFSLAATVLLGALLCAVIAWSGSSLGSSGSSACWIAALSLGFFPLIESFAVLPAAYSESASYRESVRRLDGYLGGDEAHGRPAGAQKPSRGAIELEHITYTYPAAPQPVLEDVSLSVGTGQRVAVLGRSGSGKSTLAKLICGELAPDRGAVRRSGDVGYLGQDPYLFNRTLRENLRIGSRDADDERLGKALASVGLGDKLEALSDGLDTVVGETGVGFSGGEAHRVALARVLLADVGIVLVDEPFSALDPETERGLLDTLFEACEGKTLVVITHHLAQIERFDRVVFVEDGKIDLDGSPSELEAASERFRALLKLDRL